MRLSGTGIFAFSDPGGAKAVLALANDMKSKLTGLHIYSDRQYSFYNDFGLRVNIINEKNIAEIIAKVNPDFVFTATSYTSKIELRFIEEAAIKKVTSFSFIDHWTSIRDRFKLDNRFVYPKKIFVIDDRAAKLATKEGVPAHLIEILPNPYYKFLEQWTPRESRAELFKQLGVKKENSKLVVFAPEPLSNIDGKNKYGFDELSVSEALGHSIDKLDSNLSVILKAHPNQNLVELKKIKGKEMILADASVDSLTLMYYSELVVGFFSNFLIEASILKKKVLRLLPQNITNDPLEGLGIGKIVNHQELLSELNSLK